MGQGRAAAVGLIALGAVLGGLVVLWLVTTAATGDLRAGGFVLGLILAAILGLPPIGVGYYMLQRGKVEEAETRELVGRRRVLEQDRLFRARVASEARQQAQRIEALGGSEPRLARAAARLSQVATELQGPSYDQAAWYDAVKLGDQDVTALSQYDNLISERLRRIAGRIDAVELEEQQAEPAELLRAVQAWERDLDERLELLRGQRAPTVAPGALLAAREPARGTDALVALARLDAVTYEEQDYLVEVVVTYFAAGRTWKLHRLTGAGMERWLYVAPGALAVAMLEPIEPAGANGAEQVQLVDATYRLDEQGAAAVTIESAAGPEERLAVDYWHYAGPSGELYWRERWPDGPRAYRGAPIPPYALEIWPRERTAPS